MSKYRRQIFYFSGFDPRGAGFYHTLYKSELEKFARLSGDETPSVSCRRSPTPFRTEWQIETRDCVADYAVMRWDDLARARWRRRKDQMILKAVTTYYHFLTGARLLEARKLSHVVLKTFLFPLRLVALPLLAAGLCALIFGVHYLLSLPIWLVAFYLLYRRSQPGWLLHVFAFNEELCGAQHVDLDTRCDLHAHHIASVVRADRHDEILLIGHSNGCALVMMVLDRLLALGLVDPRKLKVVTLGQLVQMVSLHRDGVSLRATLERLSQTALTWLDVSAKADPACFALVGPFAPIAQPPIGLTIASARLHKLYAPSVYKRLKADRFNFHFLYLKCSDLLGAYNYLRLTASGTALDSQIVTINNDAAHA